ncbi:PEP/pyruvate-binding domain-containing protein [Candidatus Sumerlaeota bacterium]|nr:PEP/pyruvate-binding domain-containing protein [Candidatus Sumerlaeota bacterium]
MVNITLSTGLPGLDRVLRGLIPGDNIVWQVDSIEDYVPFVRPYCDAALRTGHTLVYFRFARHAPLLGPESGARIHALPIHEGYERFLSELHQAIEQAGRGAYYVFDCLSDLADYWHSDQMLANFFLLTCPYLYDLETIAYFALIRDAHSTHATTPIAETTQLFLDVYRHKGTVHVQPVKVQQRYSTTMYMLHAWKGDEFVPVTESITIAEILTSAPQSALRAPDAQVGFWSRMFLRAQEIIAEMAKGRPLSGEADVLFERLLRMVVSRDDRVLALARKRLTIQDILDVGKRMIGSGLIGGKAVGVLLARAILKRDNPRWSELLEVHDSFFIASDVFYTYLVLNNCWWGRQRQRDPDNYLDGAERMRQRILRGQFPDRLVKQFSDMLDYFGQSPLIVRSSSLLEDNFGNAFAGKYESVFCVNQGSREKRLQDFLSAVRTIYASTSSEKALAYRARRGLLDRDEQMALLVQRVSGALYGNLFYPQAAGVGFSFNPYVWNENIDPEAGVLRLVYGLGTRAVDRADDDYTRVVALNAPERRPETEAEKARQYAQRKVDVLDLEANQLVTMDFEEVGRQDPPASIDMFASIDERQAEFARERGRREALTRYLTFENLLSKTDFVKDMREMLSVLQDAYDYPVDIEFTANFLEADNEYKINLLQCRPLQVRGGGVITEPPAKILADDLALEASGAVIGQSRVATIDRIVYVVPSVYGQMPLNERYAVARLIGRVSHHENRPETVMLLGPGRWGTTTPSLGVPVSFAEINTVSVLCEIVAMRDDLVPDVSLGTHFFSEMVELDILYMALFPSEEGNSLNPKILEDLPNKLTDLLPDAENLAHAVRVIDVADVRPNTRLTLNADALKQRVVCYFEGDADSTPTGKGKAKSKGKSA